MKQFILGYQNPNSTNLTLYPDKKTAAYESEEWCEVLAETIEEAMLIYETTFLKIKSSNHETI